MIDIASSVHISSSLKSLTLSESTDNIASQLSLDFLQHYFLEKRVGTECLMGIKWPQFSVDLYNIQGRTVRF
jgi:hypothetical protein